MICLASPYTHKSPAIREMRYVVVRDVCAQLIRRGHIVFSPIVHSHDMALANQMGFDWETWQRQDAGMIEAAQELWVAMLPGWEKSTGIAEEINLALTEMIPIKYLDPDTLDVYDSPPVMPCC